MSIFGRSYGTNISGKLMIDGKEKSLKRVRDAIEAGLAYVTEDRKGNGLILSDSIAKNTTMARLEKVCSKGIINVDKENAVADEYKEKLKTKTPSVQQAVGNLSGGNQQKVILARWLLTHPQYLILDEPTRGIDVGTKLEIQKLVLKLAEEGVSVTFISSEIEEMLSVCQRLIVMRDRKIVGELKDDLLRQDVIMQTIAGGKAQNG